MQLRAVNLALEKEKQRTAQLKQELASAASSAPQRAPSGLNAEASAQGVGLGERERLRWHCSCGSCVLARICSA